MKIIKLQAENIKRLVAVEISPSGNLVEITGRNGQGKTSVLDSIWWALSGAKHIQVVPIRKGANSARIKLDLGELTVVRTFTRADKDNEGYTTKLEVAGLVKGTPQALLDSLLGALAFDPLSFARMNGSEQFLALKHHITGANIDQLDAENSIDMLDRKDINRRAKQLRASAANISVPDGKPADLVDLDALTDRLSAAGKHNQEQERRLAERQGLRSELAREKDLRDTIAAKIEELQARLDTARERVMKCERSVVAAGEDPIEMIETADLQAQLKSGRLANEAANRHARALSDKAEFEKEAAAEEARSKSLTDKIAKREAEKLDALAKAELPVPGLTFGDGIVMLNGVPFEQASDAEQLRASCALAMAGNPALRVIRVRDGSLLDEQSLKILAEMADAKDYQVWIERVGEGKTGFVIEDGRVVEQKTEQETPAQPTLLQAENYNG